MEAAFLVIVVFPLLLSIAAAWDVASYTIPNALQLALVASFVVLAFLAHFSIAALGGHALAGALGLLVGFTLFSFGFVGGGDAKLFACVALWLGLSSLLDYALVASLLGGALALALITLRRLPLPEFLLRKPWIARLHDAKRGVPYGVALASAAIALLPQTELFHRVALG